MPTRIIFKNPPQPCTRLTLALASCQHLELSSWRTLKLSWPSRTFPPQHSLKDLVHQWFYLGSWALLPVYVSLYMTLIVWFPPNLKDELHFWLDVCINHNCKHSVPGNVCLIKFKLQVLTLTNCNASHFWLDFNLTVMLAISGFIIYKTYMTTSFAVKEWQHLVAPMMHDAPHHLCAVKNPQNTEICGDPMCIISACHQCDQMLRIQIVDSSSCSQLWTVYIVRVSVKFTFEVLLCKFVDPGV